MRATKAQLKCREGTENLQQELRRNVIECHASSVTTPWSMQGHCKDAVTGPFSRNISGFPAPLSHQVAFPLRWHGVVKISRAHMRSQEHLAFFRGKWPSPRSCSVLTATMALLQSSHGVLSRSYGVFVGDALRPYDAFNALSRRSQCMHCAFTTSRLR